MAEESQLIPGKKNPETSLKKLMLERLERAGNSQLIPDIKARAEQEQRKMS
jgi:hypothetical protein